MPDGTPADIDLRLADTPLLLEEVRLLFREYQQSLGIDLSFQHFDEELASLPGDYAVPMGGLLLAYVDGHAAGCCAFRPLTNSDYPNACEMKRLFVRRVFRGFGLGRQLVERTLMLAKQAGYDHLLLDTLDDMEAARALYLDTGFVEVAPYYHNPLQGAHYLKVEL
jgi:GNAT superfamily N-acetyltransferase